MLFIPLCHRISQRFSAPFSFSRFYCNFFFARSFISLSFCENYVHIKNALSFVAKLSVGGIKSGFLQGFLFLGLNFWMFWRAVLRENSLHLINLHRNGILIYSYLFGQQFKVKWFDSRKEILFKFPIGIRIWLS